MFMLKPGDEGLFDKQVGELAHVQLRLLAQMGPLSKNELARNAIEVEGASSYSSLKEGVKLANAALGVLAVKSFVNEKRNLFTINQSGHNALERYPNGFSPLFVQSELLSFDESTVTPVERGWGGLRNKISRGKR